MEIYIVWMLSLALSKLNFQRIPSLFPEYCNSVCCAAILWTSAKVLCQAWGIVDVSQHDHFFLLRR
jgi:hypothetical protein